jgi:Cell wall-associated hydrolases (invasion-associated proteins)
MQMATRVSNPQPGDLIFFGNGSSAYHVAIYVGNGMMIDANHPGGTVGVRAIYSGVSGYGRI